MRVGIRVPPCAPVPELAAFAAEAERSGVDEVWFPDSQLLWRDVFAVASAAVAATARITVGTAVGNVATRHPSVVASAARTVAEQAPGRFVLGLGVGNSSVLPVGIPPSTGAELRAGVEQVRSLLAGNEVAYPGVRSRLRDPRPVPIHVAASGPRNLRLAGEIADGAILLSGVAPAPLAAATARVQEGAAAAGRAPVPMTVSAFCRVTDDVERDARELKPICAGIAQHGGAASLALAGIRVDVPAQLPGVYPDLVHAEDWAGAVEACDPYVSDADAVAFARAFCLFGTPQEIVTRVTEAAAAGADAVFLQHVGSYDLPRTLLADVAERVLPLLGRLPVSSP
ncbi:5,10-methylenetetrahydromethanopterin reductase [Pseudonocardia petroleophila]|uniref:LLM class flavin-dependent oxidoreductase n=1 Tax=Pseudonocardia petroleophila TaxID=37331 RepID=A0A7G7MEU8_9PSEU|nr:LLM class flavin-dependent oxidoreductase [Pseudonocardia petroleophila]QNG51309.1 LLM class flavin-dependent oxidoreductase [Pseudonocardia petroleophila]